MLTVWISHILCQNQEVLIDSVLCVHITLFTSQQADIQPGLNCITVYIYFQMTLKSIRNQCHRQRKTLTGKLNSRPMGKSQYLWKRGPTHNTENVEALEKIGNLALKKQVWLWKELPCIILLFSYFEVSSVELLKVNECTIEINANPFCWCSDFWNRNVGSSAEFPFSSNFSQSDCVFLWLHACLLCGQW